MTSKTIIDAPNYTQTPNVILDDLLPLMKESELKVTLAIVRATFGWHRDEAEMTQADLIEATGLTKQGVSNGVNAGLERGTLRRWRNGRNFVYSIKVNEVDFPKVNEVDRQSQRSRPSKSTKLTFKVNEVDRLQGSLNKDKETLKKDKESGGDAGQSQTPLKRDRRTDAQYNYICALMERNMGLKIVPITEKIINEWMDKYAVGVIESAINIAVSAGKHFPAYVTGVLNKEAEKRNYSESGKRESKKKYTDPNEYQPRRSGYVVSDKYADIVIG